MRRQLVLAVPAFVVLASSAYAAEATATLAARSGSKAAGAIKFASVAGGVHVTGDITGLTPGEHGFHLHAKGDCSAADATSAGDHWNPNNEAHGAPGTAAHHAGDLGNITADASGKAHVDITMKGLSVGGDSSVLGKALIVHGKADDLKTQPSGNAGARVACGVVQIASAETPQ
jgi:superoxide dismutase, Cu-Zn family